MRRFGEALVKGQTYRRRPGAYAVLLRDGAVLLTHQAEPIPEYQLPGGGIDPGEGPIAALHREAFEETGWSISPPRRLGVYRRFTYMPEYDLWAEKLCSVWLARPILRRGAPSEPGHRAIWAEPAAAVELLANQGDRHFMAGALRDLGLL
ncbi:NUDIX domain-containing protein [Paenirhodobacter populi]|uniref:NUDIX domain-containing protein n=1 Tax=Paenirhodobacter populi TaxID=2306993 RepID=A0A443K9Y7_9RHOB|nr:NUDIX hydrolase [Sinirhodobacter populi]RWR04766.1 NUDIX domain-containing protein [Sinirhodobacter populi]RWR29492.1 NUDIX domain-containing protein [Sinirhodobacter populi]